MAERRDGNERKPRATFAQFRDALAAQPGFTRALSLQDLVKNYQDYNEVGGAEHMLTKGRDDELEVIGMLPGLPPPPVGSGMNAHRVPASLIGLLSGFDRMTRSFEDFARNKRRPGDPR